MSSSAPIDATSASQVQASSTPNASSSPVPTTSTSPTPTPTSTTPPTTSTPTPTTSSQAQQQSPTPSSVAASPTSSPSASTPSASSASTAAPTSSTTSTFTTQVATTIYSTNSAGSIVYLTTTVPNVVTTAISSTTSSNSSSGTSHTGVIVGSVVGGVAGITILVLLLLCIRRRVRRDDFDGNFDPDRIVGHTEAPGGTLPNVDLDATPFPQPYTDHGPSSMRQYSDSPYGTVPSLHAENRKGSMDVLSPSGASTVDAQPRLFMQPAAGPPSGAYLPPVNMRGMGPMDWHVPQPGVSPPPSTTSNTTSSARATKEREALGRSGQGLGLATQPEAGEGSGDVVVHQDAGRAPVGAHAPPREIPPAYESIPQD